MSGHSFPSESIGQLELIADYGCEIGENPLWHPFENALYWTDIPTGRLFRYYPKENTHQQVYAGRPVGGFTVQADGGLLLFMDRGTIASWREGTLTELIREIPSERDTRFNDVIADPYGRVFCGTMSSATSKGRLYLLGLDGTLTKILEGIGCSNGMGFTADRKGFYYTDSSVGEIYIFDYQIEDGTLKERRLFASIPESEGLPDGLTVDRAGRVWSALWGGAGIVRFLPNGDVDVKLNFPVRKVSSLTFGGDDLQDLYVTTAGGSTRHEDGEAAGALFRLRSQSQGVPEFLSRISMHSH